MTGDQRQAVLAMNKGGMVDETIAGILHLPVEVVVNYRLDNRLPTNAKRISGRHIGPKVSNDAIKAMYKRGMHDDEIAAQCGLSESSVADRRHEIGLESLKQIEKRKAAEERRKKDAESRMRKLRQQRMLNAAYFRSGGKSKAMDRRVLHEGEGKQLCWTCTKACGRCSWSSEFKPVKGWVAKKLPFQLHGTSYGGETYDIQSCPEYQREPERKHHGINDAWFLRIDQKLSKGQWLDLIERG